ncbi:hypothetical protein TKK_0019045 [Trichogramma kaykai]
MPKSKLESPARAMPAYIIHYLLIEKVNLAGSAKECKNAKAIKRLQKLVPGAENWTNSSIIKAGHMHGADKLARFPKVSYAHLYMQHDKIVKRHQARANEVLVLALTRGTSFQGKCPDAIEKLQQL